MRFKQFLNENQSISLDGFKHSVDTMISRNLFLWRGVNFDDGERIGVAKLNVVNSAPVDLVVYKFSARTADRKSVTGNNILLNIISKWKGFPNRLRSFFATQDKQHAEIFGQSCALIMPSDKQNK